MKKGLDELIAKNPMATKEEIKTFLEDLEKTNIGDDADINGFFKVYQLDHEEDKWLFFAMADSTIQLSVHEMVVIMETLNFHRTTVSDLRKKNIDVKDVIKFMHNAYSMYNPSTIDDSIISWATFETMVVGGNMLDSVIEYSTEQLKKHPLDELDIVDYYKGLLVVMKQHDFDKVKLYIDYSLS